MDSELWCRKTQRKAEVQIWRATAMAVVGAIAGGVIANIGRGAPDTIRPIFQTIALAPLSFIAVAVAICLGAGWTMWRLHRDPIALYEER